MLFRFGVVLPARMTEGGGVLLVAGSRPELGQWDPQRAVPMKPARPTAPLPAREPALWLAEVVLPDEDASSPFWYKFLRRQGGDLLWEEMQEKSIYGIKIFASVQGSRIESLLKVPAVDQEKFWLSSVCSCKNHSLKRQLPFLKKEQNFFFGDKQMLCFGFLVSYVFRIKMCFGRPLAVTEHLQF